MTKKLLLVPVQDLTTIMPYILKYVKPAYDTGIGETRWETLLGRAFLGEVQIWLAFNDGKIVGAASTEHITFDGYMCLHVITSSTDVGDGFEDYHYAFEEYGRHIGAKNVQFWGRKGWSRAVNRIEGRKGEKYDEVYRVFSMELKYENDSNAEPSDAPPSMGDGSS